jgi:excisionase family DNA binding protein
MDLRRSGRRDTGRGSLRTRSIRLRLPGRARARTEDRDPPGRASRPAVTHALPWGVWYHPDLQGCNFSLAALAAGSGDPIRRTPRVPTRPAPGTWSSRRTVPKMASNLLRAPEVAAILGLNPRAPYELAKDGRLPVVRLSRRAVRFRPEDVDRFIRDRLVASSRAEQDLPATVEDSDALARVAGLVAREPEAAAK